MKITGVENQTIFQKDLMITGVKEFQPKSEEQKLLFGEVADRINLPNYLKRDLLMTDVKNKMIESDKDEFLTLVKQDMTWLFPNPDGNGDTSKLPQQPSGLVVKLIQVVCKLLGI